MTIAKSHVHFAVTEDGLHHKPGSHLHPLELCEASGPYRLSTSPSFEYNGPFYSMRMPVLYIAQGRFSLEAAGLCLLSAFPWLLVEPN